MAGSQTVISDKAETIAALQEVRNFNQAVFLDEDRLTTYMPTNQLREGEVPIEHLLAGHPNFLQEAKVLPAPLLTNPPTYFLQGTLERHGTGFYFPRYPSRSQDSFDCRDETSMESAAVLEEGMILHEGQEVTAYAEKRNVIDAKVVATPQEINEVEAAYVGKAVNQAEAFAAPEGEKIGKEFEAVAGPEGENIVKEARVSNTPNKDNSRQLLRDMKEQGALREAAAAVPSVVAGEIGACKEEKNLDKAKAVPAAKDENLINELEAVAVPQVEEIVNQADVSTGKKKYKCRPRQRERRTYASPTVVLSEPRAVAAPQEEKIVEEEPVVASEGEVVNEEEAIAGSEDKTGSKDQEKVVIETDLEAVAGPEDEKFANQSKFDIGLKKEKSRLRQRERKRKRVTAHKEGVPATAREKQQKARKTQDSRMMYMWNSLKQVPSFIKQSVDKLFFQLASIKARIFGYNRTPKRILKLRAELEKKGHAHEEVGN